MVVKVYISGISGNKEVKKRQQRVLLILDSKNIKYELLDIAEPNMEEAKEYMQNNSTMNGATISDPTPRHPLPPQLYNEEEYCGDYDAFDMANETDEMEKFLKLPVPVDEIPTLDAEIKLGNGEVPSEGKSKEASPNKQLEVQENGKEEEAPKEDVANEENVSKEEDVPKEEESKEKSPSPEKDKSPSPQKEKSPSPQKEKSPSPQKEKSPSPQKEKSPSPPKEKSPSPQKQKSPSPAKEEDGGGDNETDDQKAESVENASKGEDVETANDTEETEKSEEA